MADTEVTEPVVAEVVKPEEDKPADLELADTNGATAENKLSKDVVSNDSSEQSKDEDENEAPKGKKTVVVTSKPAVFNPPPEHPAVALAKKKSNVLLLPADTTILTPEEPIVKIANGKIQGIQKRASYKGKYFTFIGIPYAKPPVKDLRFRDPQPLDNWRGVKQVMDPTRICIQYVPEQEVVIGDEDCLYLNVFTPKLPPHCNKLCKGHCAKLMPVMIYIHGGDFMTGNGTNTDVLGPDFLIQNDVVLVTINYRLNVMGFLCLDREGAPGNMGLKDQVMALKWVKNNIIHFNGDPNNVTLFGIGAGGASVSFHMLSRMSRGLFHRAIAQSGSALHHWALNEDIKTLAYKIPQSFGVEIDNDKDLLQYLVEMPAAQLVKAANLITLSDQPKGGLYCGFVPTIEIPGKWRAFLKELPYDILNEGRFNHVPLITGFCSKESNLMTIGDKVDHVNKVIADKKLCSRLPFELNSQLSVYYSDLIDSVYLNDEYDLKSDGFVLDFFLDVDYLGPTMVFAVLVAKKSIEPVYFYEFAYNGSLNYNTERLQINRPGPCHGDEYGYLFRIVEEEEKKIKPIDTSLRVQMVQMWTNFAKYKNPTPMVDRSIFTLWESMKRDGSINYLKIDETCEMYENLFPQRLELYHDLYQRFRIAKS